MQSAPALFDNHDELNLQKLKGITEQLEPGEKVIFSCNVNKHNKHDVIQKRSLLITNRYVYNLALDDKLSYLLSFFSSKAIIKRKIAIPNISGITLSGYYLSDQFIIHVTNQRDYRFSGVSKRRETIIRSICQQYCEATGNKMSFYIKKEPDLSAYQTTDDDLKLKVSRVPQQEPLLLSDKDLNVGLEYFIRLKTARAPIFGAQKEVTISDDMYLDLYPTGLPKTKINNDERLMDKADGRVQESEDKLFKEQPIDLGYVYKASIQEPEAETAKLDFSKLINENEIQKRQAEKMTYFPSAEIQTMNTQPDKTDYNLIPKDYPAPNCDYNLNTYAYKYRKIEDLPATSIILPRKF